MTAALARRIDKLETSRKAREPRKSLVLIGTREEVDRQRHQALADGRVGPNDPIARVILSAPRNNSEATVLP